MRTKTGRFDTVLVDGVSDTDPVSTGRLDPWEVERIAELVALEAQESAANSASPGAPGRKPGIGARRRSRGG